MVSGPLNRLAASKEAERLADKKRRASYRALASQLEAEEKPVPSYEDYCKNPPVPKAPAKPAPEKPAQEPRLPRRRTPAVPRKPAGAATTTTAGHGRSGDEDDASSGDDAQHHSEDDGAADEAGDEPESQSDGEGDSDETGDAEAPGGEGGDARPLTDVRGIGAASAEKLEAAGIKHVAALAAAQPDAVAEALGVTEERAQALIGAASKLLG